MRKMLSGVSRRSLLLAMALVVVSGGYLGLTSAYAGQAIILSTTTSTQDSGLLDVLVPMFEKKTGYTVKTISVGSAFSKAAICCRALSI